MMWVFWLTCVFTFAQITVDFSELDSVAVCGDGIRHRFEESCDGVDHCLSTCECEENYESVDADEDCTDDCANECVPVCDIAGCIDGCILPDECVLCDTNQGYRADCTGCLSGYSPRGFLVCEKDSDEIIDGETYINQYGTSYLIDNVTLNFTPDDVKESYSLCSTYVDRAATSVPAVWVQFHSTEDLFVSISTDESYTWTELNFLSSQAVWIGNDYAMVLQDGNGKCLHSNDDMIDYVSNSRLVFSVHPDIDYNIFIQGYYGSHITNNFSLIVEIVEHPCNSFQQSISWNDIVADGGTTNSVYSENPCSEEAISGNWFTIDGAEHSIKLIIYSLGYQPNEVVINATLSVVCSNCKGFCSLSIGGCLCGGESCQTCGNGKVDDGEDCDPSYIESAGCNSETCTCDIGFIPIDDICVPENCGNGQIDEGEECDGGIGCDNCLCSGDYSPYSVVRKDCLSNLCGNSRIDGDEECDGGSGCFECECQDGWFVRRSRLSCSKLSKIQYIFLGLVTFVFLDGFIWMFCLFFFWIIERYYNRKIDSERELADRLLPFFETNVIPFDPTNCERINPKNQSLFKISSTSLLFNETDNYVEVGKVVETSFTLTNNAEKSLHFICHAIDNHKYALRFQPVSNSIKPGQTLRIMVYMTVKCTTKVEDEINITLRVGRLRMVLKDMDKKESKESAEDGSTQNSENSQMSHNTRKRRLTNFTRDENAKSSISEKKPPPPKPKISKYFFGLSLKFESALSTKLDIDELNLIHPAIGEGTYGIVFRAEWRKVDVAVKTMKTDIVGYDMLLPNFIQEANLMETIRCQYVINFIGSVVTPDRLCLVTEFCGFGSLRAFMKDTNNSVTLPFKLKACFDVAHGMYYLHQNDIVHCDLKTDNVLVYSKNVTDPVCVKVTDFGTSGVFLESSKRLGIRDVGTPMYMAPEIHQSNQITSKCDVFSFAICMLEIYLRKNPYNYSQFPDTDSILKFVCADKRLDISDECPLKPLISRCWEQEPSDRPDFRQVCKELKEITGIESSEKVEEEPVLRKTALRSNIKRDRDMGVSGRQSLASSGVLSSLFSPTPKSRSKPNRNSHVPVSAHTPQMAHTPQPHKTSVSPKPTLSSKSKKKNMDSPTKLQRQSLGNETSSPLVPSSSLNGRQSRQRKGSKQSSKNSKHADVVQEVSPESENTSDMSKKDTIFLSEEDNDALHSLKGSKASSKRKGSVSNDTDVNHGTSTTSSSYSSSSD
ncbi:Serine-threonine protein kinase [Entamoeba marina]